MPYGIKPCDDCTTTAPTPACSTTCVNGADYKTEKKTYRGTKSYAVKSN